MRRPAVRPKSIRRDRSAAERLARGIAAAALSKQTRKNDWPPTPNDLNNAAEWIFFFFFGGFQGRGVITR